MYNFIRAILFFIAFLATSLNFTNSFASSNPVFVIAKVGNQAITNIDLINRYNLVLKISKIKFVSKQERQIVLNQILQKMIDEELQIKDASTIGAALEQNKLDQLVVEFSKSRNVNPKNIKGFFASNSLSYDSFFKQLQAQTLWSEVIRKAVAQKVKISQSDIDELLELRKINASIEKFFLSEIFIPNNYKNNKDVVDSKNLASKLFSELKNGGNFNDFVKQFSRSPTAEFNGEIGWVGDGDVDQKIYQEVLKTKVSSVTNPILMADGYYIFKVSNKRSFSSLTSQDLEQVRNIIFNKKLQLLAKGYLMNLRKNAYIEIDKKAILGI
jgi:peptidyl-prolyl cis-trans isomerase SurA